MVCEVHVYHCSMDARSRFVDGRWMRYCIRPVAVAAFFVYVTSLLTLALQRIFPYPFLFLFFGAVMGSAWFGGAVSGAISVALSTLVVAFFFVPPYYSFTISDAAMPYFISYIVCAALVSWASAYRRRAENLIRESRDLLEVRVQERTAALNRSNSELQESERNLRELTEALPQQIWRADSDGSIDYCNSHLLSYTGQSLEEMLSSRFLTCLHPEEVASFVDAWRDARRSGNGLEGEWRVRGANGGYRWFLIRAVPHRSESGAIQCWYGTHIDMEERKRAELALANSQSQLAHVTRVMSMGEVTASIAHEINQPLTAIVTHAYACLGWLKAENAERAQRTIEKIIQEGTHAGAVVTRLRALFLKGESQRTSESINQIILDTLRLLRGESVRRGVRLRIQLDSDLPTVYVDRVQLQQVLLNLAVNGLDSMEGLDLMRAELTIQSTCDQHQNVVVRVIDLGAGIDPKLLSRIFDPFFTTKEKGLGMGLAISRTVIEAHEGKLTVIANPDGGSIFEVTIPAQTHTREEL